MIRYFPILALTALLLVACGASGAPTGGSAPTQQPAVTMPPAAPTQPPEPTTPPAAPSPPKPSKGDTGSPSGDPKGVLVIFKRSGGIAGVNETLTVYDDGRIAFVGRDHESTAQIAPEELSTLRQLLANPEFAALNSRYPAMGADLFVYSITTPTGGKPQTVVTMDGAKNPPILDQVLAEMEKLFQAQAK